MNGQGFTDCSPIFVVGSDRSGTTLLQMMLNAHPGIAVAGELHFFDQVLGLKNLVPDLAAPERIDKLFQLLPSVDGFRYLTNFEPVLTEAKDRLLAAGQPSYELLYRFLLEGFCKQQGARRFGEKTTANLRYLEQLVRIFPECKIIHIVRDPRATVASRLKVPWTSDDVVTNALKWKLEVACGRSFAQQHHLARGRLLEVRYEDVVTMPAQVLRRVCEFVGEPYDERMLDYHTRAGPFVEREPWKSGTTKPLYTSSLHSWRSELSDPQVLLIELITRKEMQQYEYPRSKFGRGVALFVPSQVVRDAIRWLAHKRAERDQRRGEDIIIYGDQRRLLQMLWRILAH